VTGKATPPGTCITRHQLVRQVSASFHCGMRRTMMFVEYSVRIVSIAYLLARKSEESFLSCDMRFFITLCCKRACSYLVTAVKQMAELVQWPSHET